jgi:putative membrane protein
MKMTLTKTLIAAGAFAITSVAFADDQMNMPLTSQGFVNQAAMIDMKEVHLGELALQKSDNSDVKSFAKHMISDHSKACKALQKVAMKEGLSFPDTNDMAMSMSMTNEMGMNTNDMSAWNTNTYHDAQVKTGQGMEMANDMGTNMMNDEQMAMNLEMLSGAQFDAAYAKKMVHGHEKAIALFESATNSLDDSALKKYAAKMLPTLHHHLTMAEDLHSKVGMNSDSGMTNSMHMNGMQ